MLRCDPELFFGKAIDWQCRFDGAVTVALPLGAVAPAIAAQQCRRDEQGWFLHHWLEEGKTKIGVGVKRGRMQPKLMETFVIEQSVKYCGDFGGFLVFFVFK